MGAAQPPVASQHPVAQTHRRPASPLPASKARPGLPRGADELLARCLDPERANRPRDGRALAEALEAVGGAA